jgi:hypothetical protein
VRLSAYHSCTFREKRAVLGAFWSGRIDPSEKVNEAAREYGPYAVAMIAVISFELLVISVALFVAGSWWSWVGVGATILTLWCAWWTRTCQLRAQSFGARS